jgi:adenosylmethionine-8-amino-7-oxononanoate aminotransferase
VPDIIVLSKGYAAGYVPLGAMVAHRRLVEPVLDDGGFQHGFTYAGNPLACAAGAAVLDEIERQGLVANAEKMGEVLRERLETLMERYPIIGDVRGKGLLMAFEFMGDRRSKAPLPAHLRAFDRFVQIAYENGLIVYSRRTRGGMDGDHILVCPPLIVTEPQLDEIAEMLDLSLTRFIEEVRPSLPRSA